MHARSLEDSRCSRVSSGNRLLQCALAVCAHWYYGDQWDVTVHRGQLGQIISVLASVRNLKLAGGNAVHPTSKIAQPQLTIGFSLS